MRKELHNQLEEMVGNLRVYCRVRPASSSEKEGQLSVEVKGSDMVYVKDHESDRKDEKRFTFTQVYGPGSTQEEVFRDCESLMTSVEVFVFVVAITPAELDCLSFGCQGVL